jgi:uncharacterized protein (TIGR02271 family)
MTAAQSAQDLIGRTVVDSAGDKIGKVGQVYVNDQSGQPEWITVSTGLFGTRESFVPLYGSDTSGDQVVAGVTKDVVKDAPNVDPDGHTNEDEQRTLYDYYSGHFGWGTGQDTGTGAEQDTGYAASAGDAGTEYAANETDAADDSAAASRGSTDDAMTRSEERLNVGKEQVEAGRARLRKYVVTEQVTRTVPVSHEEVRLEREPITEDNRGDALSGEDITEAEHEVTLRAERPVVEKETVPVERVRLGTETVTEDQKVTESVRKEQIDTPDVDTDHR